MLAARTKRCRDRGGRSLAAYWDSARQYLGKQNGHWVAMPIAVGSTVSPPCARIGLMKEFVGLDVTKMYPAGEPPDKELEAAWTWDFFSQAAAKSHKRRAARTSAVS
jgi:hypothetical protein